MNTKKGKANRGAKTSKIAVKKVSTKTTTDGKDRTKYVYNGSVLGKSKLAHNVIKLFAESHPEMTTSQLQKVFPKDLQGNRDVIIPVNTLKTKDQKKRSYSKKEMLISVKDGKIAVTREWGLNNFPNFLNKAKKELKLKIVKAPSKKVA